MGYINVVSFYCFIIEVKSGGYDVVIYVGGKFFGLYDVV